jgi:hypothetical protein
VTLRSRGRKEITPALKILTVPRPHLSRKLTLGRCKALESEDGKALGIGFYYK